jgi:hypothetical protein
VESDKRKFIGVAQSRQGQQSSSSEAANGEVPVVSPYSRSSSGFGGTGVGNRSNALNKRRRSSLYKVSPAQLPATPTRTGPAGGAGGGQETIFKKPASSTKFNRRTGRRGFTTPFRQPRPVSVRTTPGSERKASS